MLDQLTERLKAQIKSIEEEAHQELSQPLIDEKVLEDLKIRFLGRNGKLTQVLKDIGGLSQEDRPKLGQIANLVKQSISKKIDDISSGLKEVGREKRLKQEGIDVTLPGRSLDRGTIHPLTQTTRDIVNVFCNLGFQVVEGPEIETDYYCFEALNIPKHHPARDMQDTFYVSKEGVLRTHTSPMQIRVMEKFKPPLRIIVPGRVYRHDEEDSSHSPMFHQIEGLLVDEDVSMGHLKWVLTHFVHELFGAKIKSRFRPSFFPFTEPSAELDMQCIFCMGKGCRVCKQGGWLEIGGCGMVHPNVFKAVRYPFPQVTGFAFGMGIERITMLLYGIDDIRHFFTNDMRFLRQFI